MARNIDSEVKAVGRIPAISTILDVVCRTTGMGFAAVARVTEDRWIACGVKDDIAFGLEPGGELDVTTTICQEVRGCREPIIINHVDEDEAYRHHGTPRRYGFQSYISVPIVRSDGRFFGTLCAIDPRPARLNTPEIIGMFRLFAELIAFHLDALDDIAASCADLAGERADAVLREQSIGVLGHDLRNPLAAIDSGVKLLRKEALTEHGTRILGLLDGAVRRMSGLIDNTLDFARGRLGGGITLSRETDSPAVPILEQVVEELRAGYPDRVIETSFAPDMHLDCDPARIAQLFSNLLGNALRHGAADQPVRLCASIEYGLFTLSVANGGPPIPPEVMERLFAPFSRGDRQSVGQGLGLGLYIAAAIARAHGGTLTAQSDSRETRFTFRMPAA